MSALPAPVPAWSDEPIRLEDASNHRRDTVLVVARTARERRRLARTADAQGLLVLEARDADDALRRIREAPPDLVLLEAAGGGLGLLDSLRSDPDLASMGVVVHSRADDVATLVDALSRGADDVVSTVTDLREVGARLRARLERRSVPRTHLVRDPVTGALTEESLERALHLESERVSRVRRPACFAYVSFHELPTLEAEYGQRGRESIIAQVVELIEADGRKLDSVGYSRQQLALVLPDTPRRGAQTRLNRLARKLHDHVFTVDGTEIKLTPVIGYAVVDPTVEPAALEERTWKALMHAASQLDLHPARWTPRLDGSAVSETGSRLRRWIDRRRTHLQVVAQQLACLGLPLFVYWGLDRSGIDVTGRAYLVVVAALALTSLLIWVECIAALRPTRSPRSAVTPYPAATAIVAAYLPNEAETVVETIEAFLAQDYEPLQVILAYNTPEDHPVEETLTRIAQRDGRFLPLRVRSSVSKAQNVNAALAHVTGEFVGVFDADHHPAPGSFRRAWRWLSSGADVVQGHCVVRNGSQGSLQRLVAAEFEAMYAVAHPGRARVWGFGIFGGSNGYWRTSLLRTVRMRSFMLTEDIDSSLRVVAAGGRIVSDPRLLSTELALGSWSALWNQRMRWAQGWSQVSLRYLRDTLRNRDLTRRQRLGLAYLLGWRELYPWISLQAFPILVYWFLRGEPPVEWFIPVFVATSAFTFSAGFAQAWTAWRRAAPSVRRHRRWFVLFGLASQLFYTELKNIVTRTAHLKEAMREHKWKVTPRTPPRRAASVNPPAETGGGEVVQLAGAGLGGPSRATAPRRVRSRQGEARGDHAERRACEPGGDDNGGGDERS